MLRADGNSYRNTIDEYRRSHQISCGIVVKILQSWDEVGDAVRRLRSSELPGHVIPEKHWDLALLAEMTDDLPRDAAVADFGCAGLYALELLARQRFRHIIGLDLSVPWQHRIRAFRRRARGAGYKLCRRDITASRLPAASVRAISCLSVVEHGVDVTALAAEIARVLVPGGRALVTTDYWPDPPDTGPAQHFGLPWRIFGRSDLKDLIATFEAAGLAGTEANVPDVGQPLVHWGGCDYTFAALTVVRR
jgi:SAM-dependent methyltransferase